MSRNIVNVLCYSGLQCEQSALKKKILLRPRGDLGHDAPYLQILGFLDSLRLRERGMRDDAHMFMYIRCVFVIYRVSSRFYVS